MILDREWLRNNATAWRDAEAEIDGDPMESLDRLTGSVIPLLDALESVEQEREIALAEAAILRERLEAAERRLDEWTGTIAAERARSEAAEARERTLAEALERIASCESRAPGDVVDVARAALAVPEGATAARPRTDDASSEGANPDTNEAKKE